MSVLSPPGSPNMFAPARPSHAKKRDASYIPRPPNAFILFRSSFIRAQHIPGQIEGNHSALSKIIGKYWKALSQDDRKVWEAKAVAALAEHRKKYPDWRFRPAANALAKVKDGPRRRGNRRGRGQSETEERSREKRCAKIADLLVEGKTGTDLAAAIQQYDCEVDRGRKPKEELLGEVVAQVHTQVQGQVQGQGERRVGVEKDVKVQHAGDTPQASRAASIPNAAECADAPKSLGTRSSGDGRFFKVPLTAMFKRSSSAPAPRARAPSPPDMQQIAAQRRESVCAVPPYFARASSFGSFGSFAADLRGEAVAARDLTSIDSCIAPCETLEQDTGSSVASATSTSSPSMQTAAAAAPFSAEPFPYAFNVPGSTCSSPPLPAMDSDADGIDTPALSPVTTPPASAFGWPYSNSESDIGSPTSISDLMGEAAYALAPSPSASSYSSLEGWAGSPQPYHALSGASPTSPTLPAYPKMFGCYVDGPEARGVMEKAFDAASCAAFGECHDWRDPFGVVNVVGAGYASPSPYVWAAETETSWGYHSLVGGYRRQGDF
ncbi:hypothetical protein GY45DRAFT_1409904 [Cubamyces sp. BRFM 1775]|nr:hypothetical protein GY45DRAFT_1409904 [Cubamyces sp. BRFM 1775]